jgi:hypothetical protein
MVGSVFAATGVNWTIEAHDPALSATYSCRREGNHCMSQTRIAYLHHHNIHLNLPSTNALISICLRGDKNQLILKSQLFF